MISKNLQRSDWLMSQPVSIQRQDRFLESKDEPKRNFREKCVQYFSPMSPLIQGLLLGILVGCLLLSIALTLWLKDPNTVSTTTTITVTSTSPTTATTTTTTTATVTYVPTGIYALKIPTCATWNSTGITVAGNQNGSSGSDLGSLATPVSIFVDNNDTLVIADRDNQRVMKYYPNVTIGIIVAGNNGTGTGSSDLNEPKGVAVDQSGDLIVADSSNYRIQKFVNGSLVGITLFSNTSSPPLGQLRDLHIDVNNNIYVTDSDHNQIVKFTPYLTNGTIIAGGGTSGSASNQLSGPFGNFIDGNNRLYVADTQNHRVLKYLPGSTTGTIVAGANGSSISGLQNLLTPMAVIVDNNEYIYIADMSSSQIVKWTTNYTDGGTCIVGCTGSRGPAANELSHPRDLKFDKYGNLYVSDQGNHRIQKFLIQIPPSCSSRG